MVGRLCRRIGDQVDSPVGHLGQRLRAGFVARRDREGVGGAGPDPDALFPAPAGIARAEDVADSAVIPVELHAHQLAAPEAQLLEMAVERLEIVVVQLLLQCTEQGREARGPEPAGVAVSDLAQFPEPDDEYFELSDGPGQD